MCFQELWWPKQGIFLHSSPKEVGHYFGDQILREEKISIFPGGLVVDAFIFACLPTVLDRNQDIGSEWAHLKSSAQNIPTEIPIVVAGNFNRIFTFTSYCPKPYAGVEEHCWVCLRG
jgi:hypothetical protein